MPDIYGINYNEVKPRPTFEELINFVDYPVKYPDRSATFTSESPLLTYFIGKRYDGIPEAKRNR